MTENMREFLEAISADREKAEKVSSATKETLIAMAKELGIRLTDADFENPAVQTLDDDELDTVAGGGDCFCVSAGSGTKDSNDRVCACVQGGGGNDMKGRQRCACSLTGAGYDS